MTGFFRELRRRRVFTTAGLYVIGAWLLLQVADVLFPGWGIPDTGINELLMAAILGFPVALVFGWFFNITARGIGRTLPAGPNSVVEPRSLKSKDYFILGTLVLVAGVIVSYTTVDILMLRGGQPDVLEKLPNSIAVLPFANESSDPENEYFCDGVSEEILNKLARYPELNVTGRTSSWQFKASDYSVPRISDLLGVRYLLQGTVQKAGDQLRISPQLVDERGTVVWSESFKRTLTDVFELQEEIANLVAPMVAPQIVPEPTVVYEPDIDAYEHFLLGREWVRQRAAPPALEELRTAVELDPGFAEAHAEMAVALLLGPPTASAIEDARESIETALTLQPGLSRALAAKGLLFEQQVPPDYDAAEEVLRQAQEAEPGMVNSDVANWLVQALSAKGKTAAAEALLYRANRSDPLHVAIAMNLAAAMVSKGDRQGAEQVLLRLLEPPVPSWHAFNAVLDFYMSTGQLVRMNEVGRRLALTSMYPDYGLALSYAMLAMWDRAEYWVNRSIREHPEWPSIVMYSALVDGWRARYPAALEAFNHRVPEDFFWYAPLDGFYLAMAGHYGAAVEILQPYVEGSIFMEGNNIYLDAVHALAFAWLRSGETQHAKDILGSMESWADSHEDDHFLRKSPLAYFFARNAALLGDRELALERLRKAIDAGWRGYYLNNHDPRWDSLKDDLRYQAMMTEVKADVDKQRLAVEKLDREQDLPAQVDVTRADRIAAVR